MQRSTITVAISSILFKATVESICRKLSLYGQTIGRIQLLCAPPRRREVEIVLSRQFLDITPRCIPCCRVGAHRSAVLGKIIAGRAVIRRAYDAMQRFFALPRTEKMKIHYLATSNHRGYVAAGDIKADHELRGGDMHEAVELAQDLPCDDPDYLRGIKFYGPNAWPAIPEDFRWALGTYFDTQLEFGERMLRAFALALDLPEDYFASIYTKPMSRLRACYYPPEGAEWDVRKIGIGAHKDYEPFTTVWQTPHAGLQVMAAAGEWIEVTPVEDTFVINIGNLMQRWTNDKFLSRPHRVVNLTREHRYSIVQFFGVDDDAAMDAFPTCKSPDEPARYPSISCGRHAEELVAKTYYGA